VAQVDSDFGEFRRTVAAAVLTAEEDLQDFRVAKRCPGPDLERGVCGYLGRGGGSRCCPVAADACASSTIGGTEAVLENFQGGRLWLWRETRLPRWAAEEIAEGRHIPIEHEFRGQSFFVGWRAGGFYLWPQIPPEEIAPSAKNNDLMVVRLQSRADVLCPVDAEKSG